MIRYISPLILILLIALSMAWFVPRLGDSLFKKIENLGTKVAAGKNLIIAVMAMAVISIRTILLLVHPVPIPQTHDEFSYLLAGDTFAHGRLTNPHHPMWLYFDTFHVNQTPTYMSKYPPAQGALLALGELLGNPWIGVLLSAGLMCGAILWMLQGWLPPRWALLGACLIALRFALISYWIDSYWGGAVAAAGGALVMGAVPRLAKMQRLQDAALLGLGIAILANSRMFEGFLLCLTVIVFFGIQLSGSLSWKSLTRPLILLSGILSVLVVFMGYYNWRLTGNAFLFPYSLNSQTYFSTPLFIWGKARAPLHYQNPQFQAYFNDSVRVFWAQWFDHGPLLLSERLIHELGSFVYSYLWPELCIPFLALPWMLRDRKTQYFVGQLLICVLGSLTVVFFFPHYVAPLTASVFFLVIRGMRHLRLWMPGGRPVGIALSRIIVLYAVGTLAIHQVDSFRIPSSAPPTREMAARVQTERTLEQLAGKHLIIVRYSKEHSPHEEWVWNKADIDGAKIVWAREIPGVSLKPLLDYFKMRKVWLAEPDVSPPRIALLSEAE